jgi:hypothetical protein
MTVSSEGIYGRKHRPKAQAKDLIVRFVCPCGCKKAYYVPIVVESVWAYERDEFGILKKDVDGNLIPKLKISHDYTLVTSIHPAWDPEHTEEYQVLYERAQAEKQYAEKYATRKPKEKLVAEQAA